MRVMEPFCVLGDNNIHMDGVMQTDNPDRENSVQGSVNTLSTGSVTGIRPIRTGSRLPYVEIVEQPASKSRRFRYECEGRSAGSIPGANSLPDNKSFPTIRIVGYKGRACIIVSCVTKDQPYRPHPHNLVGKDTCKDGVCVLEISPENNMTVTFANLGIQCVKKKDIEEALRVRQEIRVDPFRTGFEHKRQPMSIDLNAVRLCFQVFIEGKEKGKYKIPLPPVVSNPIYDKKSMADLVICRLSHFSATVAGGLEMMLFCEKVAKEDIQVKFYEECDGQIVWEGYADFKPLQVHKQFGIGFKTPRYRFQHIEQPIQVFVQLTRPSDGAVSESLPFQMLPLGSDEPDMLRRKRQKLNSSSDMALIHLQMEAEKLGEDLFNQPFQCNFNITEPEPMDNMLRYGGATGGGTSPLYPVMSMPPLPPISALGLRPRLTPQRTSPPMQNAPDNLRILRAEPEPILEPLTPPHQMPHSQEQPQNPILNKVTPDSIELGLQLLTKIDGGASNDLNLDRGQYSSYQSLTQLDSAELKMLGTPLSDNLSGLSISDL